MNHDLPITRERFVKRLVELCIRSGLPGLPKDSMDQHILMKSAVLLLDGSGSFTEGEVNGKLDYWVEHISGIQSMDSTTMRRLLVDAGYLTRTTNGSIYQVAQPEPHPDLFDEGIDQIDIMQVLTTAREDIARRKREYLEKSRGQQD